MVYDPVGGTAFMESLKTINWGAHILIIGFASGTIPKVRDMARPLSVPHPFLERIFSQEQAVSFQYRS